MDVEFVLRRQTGKRQFCQLTAHGEVPLFQVLCDSAQNSTKSTRAFLDKVWRVIHVAIREIQTDRDGECRWGFNWYPRDAGITHAHPAGSSGSNGKVGRSYRTDEEPFYCHLEGASITRLAQRMAAWDERDNLGRLHLSLPG
jgi:hypothetical protein